MTTVGIGGNHLYHAAATTNPQAEVVEMGNKLMVQGFIHDAPAVLGQYRLSKLLESCDRGPTFWQEVYETLSEPFDLLGERNAYGTPEATEEAILQTFSVSRVETPSHVLDKFDEHFRLLLHETERRRTGEERLEFMTEDELFSVFELLVMDVAPVLQSLKFCRTDNGYLGLVPYGTLPGDAIAIIHGCQVPFVLRASDNSLNYRLVGPCYVHGIMYGEALRGRDGDDTRIHFLDLSCYLGSNQVNIGVVT